VVRTFKYPNISSGLMRKKVAIVITTFNNQEIIKECLDSIRKQSFGNYDIFIVDDNSSDKTCDTAKRAFPGVNIIRKDRQSGPSVSRNLGISKTDSEYLVFMDSDVVLEKGWLKILVDLMDQNPDIGIAGGKLLFADGRINSAGGSMMKNGMAFDRGTGEPKDRFSRQEDVIYVCSAAMVARRSMLDIIGGFDETFFYGNEDSDLGWRANLSGYRVMYMPDAKAIHMLNQTVKTMGDRVYFNGVKNRIRSMIKNHGVWNLIFQLPSNLMLTKANILLTDHKLAKFNGLFWNMANLKSTLEERRSVQLGRNISDKELDRLFSKFDISVLIRPKSF
jgi:GT2 family glycosyltransferase